MTEGRVEFAGVWKKFRRGAVNDRLRDVIPALVRRAVGRAPRASELANAEFWALRDVSFSLRPGDALGILGPNGAGKSTVLRLLTRILRPTLGSSHTEGRVGALIEVGAGFHPDLTGRENVFLQGAIMGMRQREIARKFDEIVAFSGVEWFIDTPVKRYSSGMHARLGFAIAAHLDPDILVIDEAISIGDAAFQRQAFDRVEQLVRSGMPVVMVSHQLDAIAALCTQALVLERGAVTRRGAPGDCIAAYLGGVALGEADGGANVTQIREIWLEPPGAVASGGRTMLRVHCRVPDGKTAITETVGVRLRSGQTGAVEFAATAQQLGRNLPNRGGYELSLALSLNVRPGLYLAETYVWNTSASCETGGGPSVRVEVRGGPEFSGPVQMSPVLEMRVSGDE